MAVAALAIGSVIPTVADSGEQAPASTGSGDPVIRLTVSPYTLVVAPGAREPASIGSYSVRTYRSLETGDFIDGEIVRRDGSITKAWVHDLDADTSNTHLIVWCTSAGSGSYGSVDVWTLDGDGHVGRVDIPSSDEPIQGYMGHDRFYIEEGSLCREHPVYLPGDSNRAPTGGTAAYVFDLEAREWLARSDRSE